MNADLHCHSNMSDGFFAPAEVARRAHAGGVTMWSLTDHDELSGQADARRTAEVLGMQYVPGVEISVTWAARTVHVVGLGVDPECGTLVEGLRATRHGRTARAETIGEALEAIGIPGAYEGALRYVTNPISSRVRISHAFSSKRVSPNRRPMSSTVFSVTASRATCRTAGRV